MPGFARNPAGGVLRLSQTYHRLKPRRPPSLVSIVMPIYNEEAVIPILRREMTAFLERFPFQVEVVLVNDGSRDRSADLLWEWAENDPRIKVIQLGRNFGHQVAATAGLEHATGDAVVLMDADLQDPLEVINDMVEQYAGGFDVVYGVRAKRQGESIFKRASAWMFYRMMRLMVYKDLPVDAGDFRLMSRPCLEAVKSMREVHRFLRGMVAWVGFPQTSVSYVRAPRAGGETKYPLRKMLRFAWDAAVSFSTLPLRMSFAFGSMTAAIGLAYGIYAAFTKLFGYTVQGWTSLTVLVCLIGSAILICIGVLGEYVGRVFEEIKRRPLYVVSDTINLSGDVVDAASPANRSTLARVGPPAPR